MNNHVHITNEYGICIYCFEHVNNEAHPLYHYVHMYIGGDTLLQIVINDLGLELGLSEKQITTIINLANNVKYRILHHTYPAHCLVRFTPGNKAEAVVNDSAMATLVKAIHYTIGTLKTACGATGQFMTPNKQHVTCAKCQEIINGNS